MAIIKTGLLKYEIQEVGGVFIITMHMHNLGGRGLGQD